MPHFRLSYIFLSEFSLILQRVMVFAVTLALIVGGRLARAGTINETVTFSTGPNLTLNPSFVGLSYEKKQMTDVGYFSATNTALINLFNLLGPGVLRIGAGTADLYNWDGYAHCKPITAKEVDSFAGFIRSVPRWRVIYGINFASNSAANCAAEAHYASSKLGSQLLGFEIGNEPDEYGVGKNVLRSPGFHYHDYRAQWDALKHAAEPYGPLIGPATADHSKWTEDFAHDEAKIIVMATQHYYRGDPKDYDNGSPTAMMRLMTSDPTLPAKLTAVVSAVKAVKLPLGFRMDEIGSFIHGGLPGVSDANGAALWALDYMFTLALNGAQGVNFHCGGRSPYTPLYDNNNATVSAVRPEFYALKMFSLLPPGKVISATVTPRQTFFTAYGVNCTSGGICVLLNNKDMANTMAITVNVGVKVSGVSVVELSCSQDLYATSGMTLGGAAITTNGMWSGGVQWALTPTHGQVTVDVPPATAFLMYPAP
jgi:hypothetical protein